LSREKQMIGISDVTYTYPGRKEPSLWNVNLEVREAETVLIVGSSGSGKSTLLYLVNGLIPQVLGGEVKGRVSVNGLSPADVPLKGLSRHVGTLFQNVDNQLFMPRVYEDVAFGCENLCIDAREARGRVEDALRQMSVSDLADRRVASLSGGQKKRVAIAGVCAMGCRVLLLDEPLADLDRDGRQEVVELIRGLKSKGFTLLIAEHHYEPLLGLVDTTLTMERGRIYPGICQQEPPNPARRLHPIACGEKTFIRLENVTFRYEEGGEALCGVSLSVNEGECIALTGPNGCGKTTLLKILCGLLKPSSGAVEINGTVNPSVDDLVGRVGLVFQNPDDQLFTQTVAEEVRFGPRNMGLISDVDSELKRVGLQSYATCHPCSLSRGERQRLAVASVVASKPQLLLLDEPTTGLDRQSCERLMSQLLATFNVGTTVVFASHDDQIIRTYASRAIELRHGKIVSDETIN